jgi:hypothetical protein
MRPKRKNIFPIVWVVGDASMSLKDLKVIYILLTSYSLTQVNPICY